MSSIFDTVEITNWADEVENETSQRQVASKPTPAQPVVRPEPETAGDNEGLSALEEVEREFQIPEHGPFKMFVGNLKYEVTDRDLEDFFGRQGCNVADVQMPRNRSKQGFAHIKFDDRDSLVLALTFNRYELFGRSLKLDVADAGGYQSRPPRPQSTRGGAAGPVGGGRYAPRGSSSSFRGGRSEHGGGGFHDRAPAPPRQEHPRHAPKHMEEAKKPTTILKRDPSQSNVSTPSSAPVAAVAPVETSKPAVQPKPKSDPFGGARPREEVLKERKIFSPRSDTPAVSPPEAPSQPSQPSPVISEVKPLPEPHAESSPSQVPALAVGPAPQALQSHVEVVEDGKTAAKDEGSESERNNLPPRSLRGGRGRSASRGGGGGRGARSDYARPDRDRGSRKEGNQKNRGGKGGSGNGATTMKYVEKDQTPPVPVVSEQLTRRNSKKNEPAEPASIRSANPFDALMMGSDPDD
eukprot:TRINITY_DN5057_c0_g1_i1.p1 TRINITY_DN5057_c0_g1~~TRINITY_DN5057_c0_g1_i1.p1  ORF type:complete len:481 (-),score=81.85 TRINITY_DN5057_c0_g1_i1:105-1502(-)